MAILHRAYPAQTDTQTSSATPSSPDASSPFVLLEEVGEPDEKQQTLESDGLDATQDDEGDLDDDEDFDEDEDFDDDEDFEDDDFDDDDDDDFEDFDDDEDESDDEKEESAASETADEE